MTAASADELLAKFPTASLEECQRFSIAFGNHQTACKKLDAYLTWRNDHDMDAFVSLGDDFKDWKQAVEKALSWEATAKASSNGEIAKKKHGFFHRHPKTSTSTSKSRFPSSDGAAAANATIPQLVFCPAATSTNPSSTITPLTDKIGNPILQCLPAQIDLSRFGSGIFILAIAYYLHFKMDRSSLTQYTLLVDVRPGKRWPNPPAASMIGFLRQASSTLQDLLPQRLSQCLVLNVPRAAVLVFDRIVRPILFFHSSSSSSGKLHLLRGGANVDSVVSSRLVDYLEAGHEGVDLLERTRQKAFR
ncbi:hypothetical protein MPSEU_000449700 [Mayamaea pseudoterrestris]|nr:hypothetical protein MPSEU_000449700 [Mayamaea pseudoterrestris]